MCERGSAGAYAESEDLRIVGFTMAEIELEVTDEPSVGQGIMRRCSAMW